MTCLPGDEANDGEGVALGDAKFIENSGIWGEVIRVQIGKFVIAIVTNLMPTNVTTEAGWGANHACKGINQVVVDYCMFGIVKDDRRFSE